MPNLTQTSDFWGWYLRHNNRTVWRHLADAGIDVFASGPSSNEQAFLQLTNVLPAVNGGLSRRWGTSQFVSNTISAPPSISRTLVYNQPQDNSDPTNTANTNVWFATDNKKFYAYNDSGTPFAGHGPSDFTTAGEVTACSSRGWLYYGNGVDACRKVNPSYTTANTDTKIGIAIPVNAPGSTQYTDYPCVIVPPGDSQGGQSAFGDLSPYTVPTGFPGGSNYAAGSILGVTGGTGSGMLIQVDAINTSHSIPLPYGAITSYHLVNWGTGYVVTDIVTVIGGNSDAQYLVRSVPSTGGTGSVTAGSGWGYVASTSFNVSISDSAGSGTGGNLICFTDANGAVYAVQVSAAGSGYVQGEVALPAPLTGGKQAYAVIYTDTSTGKCIGADIAGPLSFVQGRQWTVALQNSLTGHTSDVYVTKLPYGPISGYQARRTSTGFASSNDQFAGFTQIGVTISVPATGLDPQVDTVILLAAPDGAGMATLYEVARYGLSTFTLASGFYTLNIQDTLPDSFNIAASTYNVQNTLLNANIWMETDAAGNTFGIALNTPPLTNLKYFTSHQGRLFATDGKTLFYSKSLDEVTTSTGLITSKWEEAWPGDFQLPLALNNEEILGLRSDGTALHAGTEKSIFTVYGSDPTTFSVPSVSFSETGVLSNDCWSVVYAEGQPSGFVWVTPDLKVIHSDFTVYREIGISINPILATLDPAKVGAAKLFSLTYGPYNFLFLEFWALGSTEPLLLLWESRLGKWYRWKYPVADVTAPFVPGPAFVYQFPTFTSSTQNPGSRFLFFWVSKTGLSPQLNINYFNPVAVSDRGTAIAWTVQTSWQDLGDPTALKVANEIEATSDDAPLNVSLYGANSQAQFDSGGTLLKSGVTVQGPISSLGSQKFYCAGSPTAARYYSLLFSSNSPGTSVPVLTSFAIEAYPIARI